MKEKDVQTQLKLFKLACKTMTEEQKDKIKGFRAWEKAQKKAFIVNKIYMLLENNKRKLNVTEVVVTFKKDLQNIASECLRDLVQNQTLGVDAKWRLYFRKDNV